MGAFLVSPNHMCAMVWGLRRHNYRVPRPDVARTDLSPGESWPTTLAVDVDPQWIMNELIAANAASYSYRYSHNDGAMRELDEWLAEPMMYRPYPRSEAELLSAARCFNYQACEFPEWPETKAYAITMALMRGLDRWRDTPEYEMAEWGID